MRLKVILVLGFLMSCSGTQKRLLVEEKSIEEEAQKVIRNYVYNQGDSLPPTLSIYKDAGVRGSNTLIVSALNEHLSGLKTEDIDTQNKLESICEQFRDLDKDGIPNFTDSDDDGDDFSDGYEVSMDTDPLDIESYPVSEPFVFTG